MSTTRFKRDARGFFANCGRVCISKIPSLSTALERPRKKEKGKGKRRKEVRRKLTMKWVSKLVGNLSKSQKSSEFISEVTNEVILKYSGLLIRMGWHGKAR